MIWFQLHNVQGEAVLYKQVEKGEVTFLTNCTKGPHRKFLYLRVVRVGGDDHKRLCSIGT